MGLPKPTIHGLVKTLLMEGYLSQDKRTRKYMVGLRVVELGSIFADNLKINQVGRELVQRMSTSTGQNARIAIWDNDSMLITYNAFPSVEHLIFQQVGPRVPAYCTAIGKAVLSTLDDADLKGYLDREPLLRFTPNTMTDRPQLMKCLKNVATKGYASENGEFLFGMSCVAVPIYDESFKAIGSISLSGISDILSEKNLSKLIPILIQTGLELSRRMGYYPETTLTRK